MQQIPKKIRAHRSNSKNRRAIDYKVDAEHFWRFEREQLYHQMAMRRIKLVYIE